MNRALVSTLLPALVAVPASYYITRPSPSVRPMLPISAAADRQQSALERTPAPEETSYSKDGLAKCLKDGAEYYKNLHRKELDAEVSQWMMKVEPSLVVYVPQMNDRFIDEMSYIKQMYVDSKSSTALGKYLFTKRAADALAAAKSPEELRMVQIVAKHYHLTPLEVRAEPVKQEKTTPSKKKLKPASSANPPNTESI